MIALLMIFGFAALVDVFAAFAGVFIALALAAGLIWALLAAIKSGKWWLIIIFLLILL